jgi:hypothetical protein
VGSSGVVSAAPPTDPRGGGKSGKWGDGGANRDNFAPTSVKIDNLHTFPQKLASCLLATPLAGRAAADEGEGNKR